MQEALPGKEKPESRGPKQRAKKKYSLTDRVLGLTRPTNILGTEHPRGLVERFERAKLAQEFKSLKRRKLSKIPQRETDENPAAAGKRRVEALLNDPKFGTFREQTDVIRKNFDALNAQFFDNIERVHIEDEKLGIHDIPVVTLDLNPPKEGTMDERIPYFIVPTYIANPDQVAFFAESLALEGQKVYVMTYPEKYKISGSGQEWLQRVKEDGTLGIYVNLVEKIVQGLNLENFNLVGLSMGAPVVMEMASDPEFGKKINDLIAVDPPSIRDRSGIKLLLDFGIDTALSATNRELMVKAALASNRPEMTVSMGGLTDAPKIIAPILGRAEITADMISKINPKGKFEVWTSGDSSITGRETQNILLEAEKQRRQVNPGSSPLRLINAEGYRHQHMFSTLGMADVIVNDRDTSETVITIGKDGLATNAAQAMSRGIRFAPKA